MPTVTWASVSTGGNWNDAAGWSGNAMPGAGDDVAIAHVTVAITAPAAAHSIAIGTVGQIGRPGLDPAPGLVVGADLAVGTALAVNAGSLHVLQDLTLDGGTLSLNAFAEGSFFNVTPYTAQLIADGTLTLGTAETFRVKSNSAFLSGAGTLVNAGTMVFEGNPSHIFFGTAPGTLAVSAGGFANAGTILLGDGTLSLAPTTRFANTGAISLDPFGVLGVWLDAAPDGVAQALGTITGAGTLAVGLARDIANAGSTFDVVALNAAGVTGYTGTLTGGTIAQAGGTIWLPGVTLDAVTVAGTLAPSAGSSLTIMGGIAGAGAVIDLTGTVSIGALGGRGPSTLRLVGSQTLDGLTLRGTSIETTATLTLGAGATLETPAQTYLNLWASASDGAIVNAGTILTDDSTGFAASDLIVAPHFLNAGSILVGSGGVMQIVSAGFANTGTIAVAAGSTLDLALESSLAALPGRLGSIAGGSLDIALIGTIANAGTVFSAAAANALHVTALGTVTGSFASATLAGGSLDPGGGTLTWNQATLDAVAVLGSFDLNGTLTLRNGSAFTGSNGTGAGLVTAHGGSLAFADAGTTLDNLTLDFGAVVQNGSLSLSGNTLLTLGTTFRLDGAPAPERGNIGFGSAIRNLGTIALAANAATLIFYGATRNDGMISLAAGDVALFQGGYGGFGTVSLLGNAEASFDPGSAPRLDVKGSGNRLYGIGLGTTIRLDPALHVTGAVFTPGGPGQPGTLAIMDGATQVQAIQVQDDLSGDTFPVSSAGGFAASLTVACFAAGTRIATARGPVAVERLRPGDVVTTRFAGQAEVVWLGHRRIDCRRHPRPWDVQPVRIAPDAFGPGKPARPLRLSPDHAVLIDGTLIPVRYLVNGATIVQEAVRSVTYWHVELARHDALLAEGLDCESYLDTGNRAAFANGGAVAALHPDFAARDVWAAESCAPLALAGPAVLAARSLLHRRAMLLGHRLSREPGLELLADGAPQARLPAPGRIARFALRDAAAALRLRSSSGVPAEMAPAGQDTRRLGVMLGAIHLAQAGRRRAVALPDGPGLHPAEDGWRWTDGDAVLHLAGMRGPAVLDLEILAVQPHWRATDAACRRPGRAVQAPGNPDQGEKRA